MKKIFLLLSLVMTALTSCLERGLEEVTSSELCDVSNVEFEYRWTKELIGTDSEPSGVHELYYQPIDREIVSNDKENHKITVKLTVPEPSGEFSEEIRNQVSLQNIVCMFTVSTAAKVEPLGSAPVLGKPGDFSQMSYTYRVTSASGAYADWVLEISEFDTNIEVSDMQWNDGYEDILQGSVGDEMLLKVKLAPEYATDTALKWEVDDPDVAIVDENGLLKMVGKGAATLTVSTTDGSDLSLSRRVAVDYIAVQSITLNSSIVSLDLQKNTTYTFAEPTIAPDNAMSKELEWSVADENVATFDPLTRILTAVSVGITTLTVTSTDGFGAQTMATVMVTEEPEKAPEPEVYIGANDFTESSGIDGPNKPTADTEMVEEIPLQIESVHNNAYAYYGNNVVRINFYNYITLRVATEKNAGHVEVHLDAADGPLVATVNFEATGSWTTYKDFTVPLDLAGVDVAKTHTLYLTFHNSSTWVCNMHYIKLSTSNN